MDLSISSYMKKEEIGILHAAILTLFCYTHNILMHFPPELAFVATKVKQKPRWNVTFPLEIRK